MVFAALGVLLVAYIKPWNENLDGVKQLQADKFWIMKAQNHNHYNLVIMGDSRSYRGVSPAEMMKYLPGTSVFNFGFSSGALNNQMFTAAERLLDSTSNNKAILMGVTVSSLLPDNENNVQYTEEVNRPHSAYLERVYINDHFERFAAFDHDDIFRFLTGKHLKNGYYYSNYYPDGWVSSNKEPEDTTEQLKPYGQEMEKNKVSPQMMDGLLAQTKKWTEKGIDVYAFRPPTTQAMHDLENQMGGLDYPLFEQRFAAAGGHWIEVERAQYHSYDGSHIDSVSAIKLSKYLAEEIKKSLN